MSPLVSIMTPCYNGEKYVGRYLDSVLTQTYDNIEVVIVDDGSTDNTAAIIKSYIPKFESKGYKLVYVYQENGGAASAISTAMSMVNGDFISWFDSDDILLPFSTEKRVNFLQQNPQYDFCICQMLEVSE
ncbi:MAG: glycosyltransferase family 2 protein, partial [Selenomonadaceae bacterium]|nr:glycosyltransferase family 2 protein [Selenomonadaceae bacterium]